MHAQSRATVTLSMPYNTASYGCHRAPRANLGMAVDCFVQKVVEGKKSLDVRRSVFCLPDPRQTDRLAVGPNESDLRSGGPPIRNSQIHA